MGLTGLETSAFPSGITHDSQTGGSKSGNTPPTQAPASPAPDAHADPELAVVVAAWADLPPALRAGIVAMVKNTRVLPPG